MTKTLYDKVTASNIAYTILVHENIKEVWEEDLQTKASSKDDMERCHATCHKKPKYREGWGKHLKRFCDGCTENGLEYYQELLRIFKNLKSSDVWQTLQEYWKLHQRKHNARGDNKDDDLRAPEEECVASDKDDWQIDMPVGDDTSEVQSKMIIMGHQISSCHVPVVRSFFIL
jgi:hypothetical protein